MTRYEELRTRERTAGYGQQLAVRTARATGAARSGQPGHEGLASEEIAELRRRAGRPDDDESM